MFNFTLTPICPIFLIGYRGSGKSRVGRELARVLERPFADADELFCERVGSSISEFVADSGWEEFRRIESEILAENANRPGLILATGGGVVLDPANREILRQSGLVIWLKISPAETRRRLSADPKSISQRPALTGLDPVAEITAGIREREPLYRQCADIEVSVDHRSVNEIVAEIIHCAKSGS